MLHPPNNKTRLDILHILQTKRNTTHHKHTALSAIFTLLLPDVTTSQAFLKPRTEPTINSQKLIKVFY